VHPLVTVRQTAARRFIVRVVGGRSFAGRRIQVQRRSNNHWTTIKRVRLGVRSRAEFKLTLRAGTSRIRIALSVNQAGAGFLGGTSRTITVKR
jgi:hypothetical protein